jgi:hypothetical protein
MVSATLQTKNQSLRETGAEQLMTYSLELNDTLSRDVAGERFSAMAVRT